MLPRPPFRLDLTVWALRRREQNRIDTWDGRTYRRALLVDGAALELAVTQVGHASMPRLEVVVEGRHATSSAEAAARSTLARLLGLDLGVRSRACRVGPPPLRASRIDDAVAVEAGASEFGECGCCVVALEIGVEVDGGGLDGAAAVAEGAEAEVVLEPCLP